MSGLPTLRVLGVGLLGPGLDDWQTGQALLREPAGWVDAPTVLPVPARLPPAERRRSGAMVRLSLAVADQACAMAAAALGEAWGPANLATVFSSSSGDPVNCDALCQALAQPERAVSPTRFTNSVHNATAGYWHIAAASRAASTSLCGHDASLAAGLVEAAGLVAALDAPVLLVASDVLYPEPLRALRPTGESFGLALVLAPDRAPWQHAPHLRLALTAGDVAPSTYGHAGLDALCLGVPAARGLPLLQALARGRFAAVDLAGFDGLGLRADVQVDG